MNSYTEKTNLHADKIELLDILIDSNMTSNEYSNNQNIIEKLGDFVDDFMTRLNGYALFSITNKKTTELKLLIKTHNDNSGWRPDKLDLYSWVIPQVIEQVIDFKLYKNESNLDLINKIIELKNFTRVNNDEIFSAVVVETFNGYDINLNKFESFQKLINIKHTIEITLNEEIELRKIYLSILQIITDEKNKIQNNITTFITRLNCPKLTINYDINVIDSDSLRLIKIDDVKSLGIKRFYTTNSIEKKDKKYLNYVEVNKKDAISRNSYDYDLKKIDNIFIAKTRTLSNYSISDYLAKVPFNFIDASRYILIVDIDNYSHILISEDPRINPNYLNDFLNCSLKYINLAISTYLNFNNTTITKTKGDIQFYNYKNFIKTEDEESPSPLQQNFKILKLMVDEYNYVDKKQKVQGSDILITDKIKYNNSTGAITYNDFNIAVDDKYIQSALQEIFESFLVQYYRNDISEQQILDQSLDKLFKTLSYRLQLKEKDNFTIPITINNLVKINIECKKSTSETKLFYINNQRFNKNEIILVIREMTCYRTQNQADLFIKNIGKVGLSVYIGITTGYELTLNGKNTIFKFKKEKGRSNYQLILESLSMPIVSKELINVLYRQFIGDANVTTDKLKTIIYKLSNSSKNYLKYKFLIDSTYTSFYTKSKELLDRKIKETESKEVKYVNASTHKKLDAILITGSSTRQYVLAYDKQNSYVFIDPILDKTSSPTDEIYASGKYICMIDQSNIKNNIGFDTVIAKLLALKHDSIIAKTIYNLEDELD